MQIFGPQNVHGPQPISPTHNKQPAAPVAPPAAQQQDEVSISDVGLLLEKTQSLPEVRQERVDAIRAALADGTYDVNGKLGQAVDNLLDEIG
ncbi:MAG: flagellar biosynthesis anti-sigma factor FlgM [Pirellulales bacterium]|nr:flagellar biosynthesis anti-sigma factor FlgM [Pirellulales bacterium]